LNFPSQATTRAPTTEPAPEKELRTCDAHAVANYLLAADPVVVLVNRQARPAGMQLLYDDPRFQQTYQHRYVIGPPNQPRLIDVYEHRRLEPRRPQTPTGLVLQPVAKPDELTNRGDGRRPESE